MRRVFVILIIFFFLPIRAVGEGIEEKIIKETEIEKASELLPDSIIENTEIDFSPTKTPSENGLDPKSLIKTLKPLVFKGIREEASFVLTTLAVLVISNVILSFADAKKSLLNALHFSLSAIITTLIIAHVENAFSTVVAFTDEISVFITGLIPFLGSVSLVAGEISTSAVQSALLMFSVSILELIFTSIVIPILKVVISLIIVGYISKLSFSALSGIFSNFAQKIVTVLCGVMCIILYFQNSVSAVTDSLALRSLKLATGNLIPIVGSFVSEASATLVSGIRLVKTTFGVFAIAVLLYLTLFPLLAFFIKKLSLRFLSAIAKLMGCEREGGVLSEVAGVYNVLSAVMIATSCFFIFAVAVFIKSEVG